MMTGDRVTYSDGFKSEKGIVKSLCENPDYVFVVYYCADKWADYKNYTSARTWVGDLKKGWPE